jgi:hypothetical protein
MPVIAPRLVVVVQQRDRLMSDNLLPLVRPACAPALHEQDGAAELSLDLLVDAELVPSVPATRVPARSLPLAHPEIESLHRFQLGRGRGRGLAEDRRGREQKQCAQQHRK